MNHCQVVPNKAKRLNNSSFFNKILLKQLWSNVIDFNFYLRDNQLISLVGRITQVFLDKIYSLITLSDHDSEVPLHNGNDASGKST